MRPEGEIIRPFKELESSRVIGYMVSNAISLIVVALSGIAVNSILAFGFEVSTLGSFNQLFAIHVVGAQLAAFGLHLSCLHYLSSQNANTEHWAAGARAAIGAAAGVGSIVAAILWGSAGLIEYVLESPNLAEGICWVSPAVALFGVNKVVMSICNASDRLHTLAFLQALRPIVWLAGASLLVGLDRGAPARLGQILLAGELIATLFGITLISKLWCRSIFNNTLSDWWRIHLRFGLKAMPSNLIIDLNTRIDVLILAFFANDSTVGIYGFVALLAEGVYQVGVVVRTVITRSLVRVLVRRDPSGLLPLKRQAGRLSLLFTILTAGILAAGFSMSVSWLQLDPALLHGQLALWVLLTGVVTCSVYSPFWMVLVLAGRPIEHTKLMLALCLLNIGLNVAFIPFWGMLGAAIGTAIMLATFPFMLSWSAKRVLGMDL